MCTAITYKTKDSYFGRNLDLEYSYKESVAITPKCFPFEFKNGKTNNNHYAIIGTAFVKDNYPLYYDAVNEKGLAMAGLNFSKNAVYFDAIKGKNNIATYEFIPYILSDCDSVTDAEERLKHINLIKDSFREDMPPSPLHWIISDKEESITVECVKDGIKVYKNPYGVLTNNPPFEKHIENLKKYDFLTAAEPENSFENNQEDFCVGMGGVGLPGDLSSKSRFVRAYFTKKNSISKDDEKSSVGQFFHILSSVEMTRGCVRLEKGEDITVYSSCCNQDKGIYYYKTYGNSRISAVCMHNENLEQENLITYPFETKQDIFFHN